MYEASAPGSLMLLGEYAVLYAKPALVAAVDQRISVTIIPEPSNTITVHTAAYGTWTGQVGKIKITPPFSFVTASLAAMQLKLPSGCSVHITSQYSDQLGLGSSAAVTVATLAAIHAWLQLKITKLDLLRLARTIVRRVQGGRGSGADLAASIFGGIVYYQPQALSVTPCQITDSLPLAVIYSGSKLPTPQAITYVRDYFAPHPRILHHLCASIAACVNDAYAAINAADYVMLAKIFNIQQGVMTALGVSTPTLDALLAKLRQSPQVMGAKISGAGFGDCVLALGSIPPEITKLPINITPKGLA